MPEDEIEETPEPEEVETEAVEETETEVATDDTEDAEESEEEAPAPDDAAIEAAKEAAFLAEAEKRGFKPVAEEPKPEETEEEPDIPNFMERALAEATAKGKDYEWAQNRASILSAEWVQEETQYRAFVTDGARHIQQFEAEVKANGIPAEDAPELAKRYHERLKQVGREAVKTTAQGKALRDWAYSAAKGDLYDKQLAARKADEGDRGEPRTEAARGNAGGGREAIIGDIDKSGREFIKQWEQAHNEGKPASLAQIKALKEKELL